MKYILQLVFVCFLGSLNGQALDTVTLVNFETYEEMIIVREKTNGDVAQFRSNGVIFNPWSNELKEVSKSDAEKIFQNGFSIIVFEDEFPVRMRPTKASFYEGDSLIMSMENKAGLLKSDMDEQLFPGRKIVLDKFNFHLIYEKGREQSITLFIKE